MMARRMNDTTAAATGPEEPAVFQQPDEDRSTSPASSSSSSGKLSSSIYHYKSGTGTSGTSLLPLHTSASSPSLLHEDNHNNQVRVRVGNETTQRYKDVLVTRRSDTNCYDALYNHPAIKEAHIRKWTTHIAQQVQKGLGDISCALFLVPFKAEPDTTFSKMWINQDQQSPIQVFSVAELKSMTTDQFVDQVTTATAQSASTTTTATMRVVLLLRFRSSATTHSQPPAPPRTTKRPLWNMTPSLSSLSTTSNTSLSTVTTTTTSTGSPSPDAAAAATTTPPSSLQERGLPPPQQQARVLSKSTTTAHPNSNNSPPPYGCVHVPTVSHLNTMPEEQNKVRTEPNNAATTTSSTTGISLPAHVVQDVFPYHIVLDEAFQILQVGNRLDQLLFGQKNNNNGQSQLVHHNVYDILRISGPIPCDGVWEWSLLDRLAGMTVFFEAAAMAGEPSSSATNARVKGTIIELSTQPRQIMLALFPDVKNLDELSRMNLTMTDLPLHSCQRDSILMGEHSASEVKLTHHLDQQHRELIDSMEQQIKDRTQELAEANRHLEHANTQLAEQSARQLEHFASMSHEIRTPLNCIIGMTSLMIESADTLPPDHAEAAKLIHGSGELLRLVVNDVLDFARLSSGTFETVIRDTNLRDTLHLVSQSIQERFRQNNITLRTQFASDLPQTVQTDSRRILQVLYNLLGNAGKFSKPGGFVDLNVALISAPSTNVNQHHQQQVVSKENTMIRFSVKDYGKGIKKEDFQKIFQPFSQATRETVNGTGLGLSITSKLVENLGGTITVDSQVGEFAEFTVDLPFVLCETDNDNEVVGNENDPSTLSGTEAHVVNDATTSSTAANQKTFPRRQDLKVLYAEDNKVNQKVLRRVLQHVGVSNVDIVENGQDAVDRTAQHAYDLIFMDMSMPVMGGVEATELITTRDADAHVIFVTAHALNEFRASAEAAGGKGFISKPFRKTDIEEVLVDLGIVA